jgi:hypothetical protein
MQVYKFSHGQETYLIEASEMPLTTRLSNLQDFEDDRIYVRGSMPVEVTIIP